MYINQFVFENSAVTILKNGTVPRLASDVNLEDIGKSEECDGYTGADLAALVREASVIALKEFMLSANSSERDIMVTNDHFKKAILKVRPSVSEKPVCQFDDTLRIVELESHAVFDVKCSKETESDLGKVAGLQKEDQKHYEKLRKMYSPFTGSTEMEAMECS
ncbi:hypothetical protein NQ317_016462 [Molorchus minor]|uniref:AAA ATPase AAA+ lid domain-containing protein n=1 Tax=Molorchus minor TaxID=1323400 RepID=A0ABQ9K2R1_9CUCU|nr:hypothetical protein NQ317_016462 [Molorchus minor]